MALKRYKATSPGRRGRVDLKTQYNKPSKIRSLLKPLKGPKGRSRGKISVRHQSRGAKKHYRLIDFKRNNLEVPGRVVSIEYDPNRNTPIALVNFENGDKRYILACKDLKVGSVVVASENKVPVNPGNCTRLKNIPLGVPIHNIELHPNRGGQMARSAGVYATITAKEGNYANLKMPSGEVRKVQIDCFATIGQLTNEDYKNTKVGKAGRKRHMGVRPTVRGVAFSNPRDHSHGGSYGTGGIGKKSPVSPTGVPSKGYKTRKRKNTLIYKVNDRRRKK